MSKLTADRRLSRLLALVPWVAARDGPRIEDVCSRFGCAESELVSDLESLFLCGLYPYTPDMLVDVDFAEGRVWIRMAEFFVRPLRLTPAEAWVLVAAGQALLTAPGAEPDGPLARALTKLATALGVDPTNDLEISMGGASDPVMKAVRDAHRRAKQLEIEYYTLGRDEWTTRIVDPHEVFSTGGQWYLTAYCQRAEDERVFRLDRMRSATVLASSFLSPVDSNDRRGEGPVAYRPGPGDPRVTLE
ncbi:MAG: helix-turn-helix transcriptional regulator, partial [Pseudonocardiaceae bacterium]